MATYFVSSAGSNTSPYDTWAKAANLLETALALATTDNNVVVLDVAGVAAADAEVSANKTWTFAGNVSLICSTNSGTGTITPTVMGETRWIGNSTTARTTILAGAKRVYIYGLTVRALGTLAVGFTDGCDFRLEDCLLWISNAAVLAIHQIGNVGNTFNELTNCTLKQARSVAAATGVTLAGESLFNNCTFTWAAKPNAGLITPVVSSGHQVVQLNGCDLSSIGSSAIVGNNSIQPALCMLSQCKLGASAVILATQTSSPNKSSARAFVFDCSSGDTHGLFGYYDALGSVVSDSGIYFTAGAAAQSWKISTTANCSYYTPFTTPWVDLYNTGISAVTPWFEIARDGSATAYQNDEVWSQFFAKTTSETTKSSLTEGGHLSLTDKLAGTTPTDITSGTLGSWSPGSGSPGWAGKCAASASITPAENGHIRGRIVVGEPSITVYVDPQIRV